MAKEMDLPPTARWQSFVGIVMRLNCQSNLFEIVLALRAPPRLPHHLHRLLLELFIECPPASFICYRLGFNRRSRCFNHVTLSKDVA